MEINYFANLKWELGKKQFYLQKCLILYLSRFMVVWNRKDDRKEDSLISGSHKMVNTLTWGVCPEPFWKKRNKVVSIQNGTLGAIGSSPKQPGSGSPIQDMTDSGLRSHSVNNLTWLGACIRELKPNPSALMKLASTFLLHIPHFTGYS